MDTIVIHGPPAAGKFTVGEMLAERTGYKLIHIHSIYDFLEDIFEENYLVSLGILNNIYLNVLEEAAKLNFRGVIITYAEIARNDFEFIRNLKNVLDRHGGSLRAVRLCCNSEELYKRVVDDSRKRFKKTNTVEELRDFLSRKDKDYTSTFSEIETFSLDNTNLPPSQAAQEIAGHFAILDS